MLRRPARREPLYAPVATESATAAAPWTRTTRPPFAPMPPLTPSVPFHTHHEGGSGTALAPPAVADSCAAPVALQWPPPSRPASGGPSVSAAATASGNASGNASSTNVVWVRLNHVQVVVNVPWRTRRTPAMLQADCRNGPPSPTLSTVSTLSSLSSLSSLFDLDDLILPSPESKPNSPPPRKRKSVSRSPSPSPTKTRRGRNAPSPPLTRSRRGRIAPSPPPPTTTRRARRTAPSPPPAKARRGRGRTVPSPPPPPRRRGQPKPEVVAAVPLEPQPEPDLDPALQLDKIRLDTPDDDSSSSDDESLDPRINAAECPCPFCGGSFLATWDDLVAELYERVLKYFPTAVQREQDQTPKSRKDHVQFIRDRSTTKCCSATWAQRADAQERFCLKHRRRGSGTRRPRPMTGRVRTKSTRTHCPRALLPSTRPLTASSARRSRRKRPKTIFTATCATNTNGSAGPFSATARTSSVVCSARGPGITANVGSACSRARCLPPTCTIRRMRWGAMSWGRFATASLCSKYWFRPRRCC
ncbi:hypothetical protein AMAG_04177 [Allomyces macrogynus ATCC 38327]|uniref:Uncharacterized protein n=1 Tax=Allomyces macrogynus (strain ATCC 38327) TaxID=578462 RepID=A0A0L0S7P8_ALLM3|nr:hypothetical protein AMAG_04177 [Allomyces macrogynus ATCC 38327]|eukprot:KNE58613.1 hypothetical protein AMAG_04177 [Allomyces macrogynus ATCC 38327]